MRGNNSKPSLFSFQDIITAVIGIFIFISIVLILSISEELVSDLEEKEKAFKLEEMNYRENIIHLRSLNLEMSKRKAQLDSQLDEHNEAALKITEIESEIKFIEEELKQISLMENSTYEQTIVEDFIENSKRRVKRTSDRIARKLADANVSLEKLQRQTQSQAEELEKYKNGIAFVSKDNKFADKDLVIIDASLAGFKLLENTELMSLNELELYLASLDKDKIFVQFIFRESALFLYSELSRICVESGLDYGISIGLEEAIVYE